MTRGLDELTVRLSLWELLAQGDDEQGVRSPYLPDASVEELRESVIRHLEVLLNTRNSESDPDPAFPECSSSVLAYGVADFSSLILSDGAHCESLRRSAERAVRMYEPRLTRVKVALQAWDQSQTALSLSIIADLRVEPENEPVEFNAFLAKDSRRFLVSGRRA
jgi:type VI secretion system protein ImpF